MARSPFVIRCSWCTPCLLALAQCTTATGVDDEAQQAARSHDSAAEQDESATGAPTESGDAGACPNLDAAAGVCVKTVGGSIVDEEGAAPAAGSLVSVCGPVCYAGETDVDGHFEVAIGRALMLEDYSTLLHGRPHFAGFYFPVPRRDEESLHLGELRVHRLPEAGPPVPQSTTEALVLESSGVQLELPAGIETRFDFEALNGGDLGTSFRARMLPRNAVAAGQHPEGSLDVFYALGPFETFFHQVDDAQRRRVPVRLSFPNTLNADADADVEVFALGSYLYPDWVAPARFQQVARARVSADAERIEMVPDHGVELLTWIGLRTID